MHSPFWHGLSRQSSWASIHDPIKSTLELIKSNLELISSNLALIKSNLEVINSDISDRHSHSVTEKNTIQLTPNMAMIQPSVTSSKWNMGEIFGFLYNINLHAP